MADLYVDKHGFIIRPGDKVTYEPPYGGVYHSFEGNIGTVLACVDKDFVAVEFKKGDPGMMHDCDGLGKNGFCYYCLTAFVEILDYKSLQISDSELRSFLGEKCGV